MGLFPAVRRATGSQTSIAGHVSDVEGIERFRWILRNTILGAMLVYVLYLGLFAVLGIFGMAVIELACLAAFVLALRALHRGAVGGPFIVSSVVAVGHAIVATVVFGLSSGFFIHVPFLTVLTFLRPHVRPRARLAWGVVSLVVFTGLIVLGEFTSSLLRLPPITDASMAIFNATAFVLSIGFLAHTAQEAAQSAEHDLRAALARLDELARTDALTGLLNRRAMTEQIDAEIRRVARTDRPFALVVVDLDDFKAINDAHGHAVGDQALEGVAGLLRSTLRSQDQVARWGGEEFLLLLPETNLETAISVAERLRSIVAESPLTIEGSELRTTATFGVTVYALGDSLHDTVRKADRALYDGKLQGKDQVVHQVN